ncbi:4'-phosphopantetheinyl transferase family protein [Aquimarina intermedia]|uniref:4'-phosphopantetheinyl transferase superfamily protein n=1 Tax=Aquimarina intermedia TaxID=350814 RepID=A0A5S5C7V0_9FLAO|nr:4'-phosphopantetheinyl transferase superfamily protein [Aquimarina intermedia]TYP75249.1 4'-phosphopantetheinyl transferase superfamily protein [Aquimarina intermedia]
MIGNDLVDLVAAKAQSNWKRSGWLSKIFTAQEQDQILQAPSPDRMVWHQWSRKEAAYKAHQRVYNHVPTFNPIQIDTTDPTFVRVGTNVYKTTTTHHNNRIHSTAIIATETAAISQLLFERTDSDYKTILLSKLAKAFTVEASQLILSKNKQEIPQLVCQTTNQFIPISISHHGAFVACVWMLPKSFSKQVTPFEA